MNVSRYGSPDASIVLIQMVDDHDLCVYLSLGDREEKTRNLVMATVGDRIREAHDLLKAQGQSTILEWNPGNHFKDADIRTARGFAWVMNLRNGV